MFEFQVQLTPPPNLVVQSIFTLGQSFSGQPTTISWQVRNTGIGITATGTWSDSVHLSLDDTIDNSDTLLAVVQHTGELISNSDYPAITEITLPNAIYGDYFLIVTTDYYSQVYEHTDEGDNVENAELAVILSATPDFTVQDLITSSASLSTGDLLTIDYTVRNRGGGHPFERWWRDQLTIVSIGDSRTYHTAQVTISQTLPPSSTYTRSFSYQFPPSLLSDTYNITIHTDYQNHVFEYGADDNNIETVSVDITQSLPDLEVQIGEVRYEEAAAATHLFYNITIINNGPGRVFGTTWTDAIYLSDLSLTDSTSTLPIIQRRQTQELQQGWVYIIFSGSYVLNPSISGQYTLYIATDFANEVYETVENNNFKEIGTVVIPQRVSKLVITQGEVSSNTVTSGNQVTVTWDMKNEGNLAVEQEWYDSVYFARDSAAAGVGALLGRVSVRSGLGPNGITTNTLNFTVPIGAAGTYTLTIRAAENINSVTETSNVYTATLQVLSAPSPDLQVLGSSYEFIDQEDGAQSRVLSVRVEVINAGNGFKEEVTWVDRAVVRERTFPTSRVDVVETSSVVTLSLPSQGTYSITHLLVLPAHINGFYELVRNNNYFFNHNIITMKFTRELCNDFYSSISIFNYFIHTKLIRRYY